MVYLTKKLKTRARVKLKTSKVAEVKIEILFLLIKSWKMSLLIVKTWKIRARMSPLVIELFEYF